MIAPIAERAYARPELLAETAWLAEHLSDPRVRVVDIARRELIGIGARSTSRRTRAEWRMRARSTGTRVESNADSPAPMNPVASPMAFACWPITPLRAR